MTEEHSLLDLINEKLEKDEVELPVFDPVALKVYRAVRTDDLDAGRICEILEEDPVLVSEVLKVSNSSFFSGLGEVTRLSDAVVRLGAKQLGSLALAASQKRIYSASAGRFKQRLTQLWRHTSAVSLGARWLARKAGYSDQSDEAYVAGLLHDVGKVSLLRIIEDLCDESGGKLRVSDPLVDMTLKRLYTSHGVKLLEQWNIPKLFQRVIAQLEDDDFDDGNVILAIVRLADLGCAKEGISDYPDPSLCLETTREAQCLGLSEIMLAELQVVLEDAAREAA